MDTGKCEEAKRVYLLEEVMRTLEMVMALRSRIWDVFVKGNEVSPTEKEALPANPIDCAISISQSTQHILKQCMELLEMEIIDKLVGN